MKGSLLYWGEGGGAEFNPGHFRVCGFWMCALYIWGLELSGYCQEGP